MHTMAGLIQQKKAEKLGVDLSNCISISVGKSKGEPKEIKIYIGELIAQGLFLKIGDRVNMAFGSEDGMASIFKTDQREANKLVRRGSKRSKGRLCVAYSFVHGMPLPAEMIHITEYRVDGKRVHFDIPEEAFTYLEDSDG